MTRSQDREIRRRRLIYLAPLMIACNGLVLLCIVGLVLGALGVRAPAALSLRKDATRQAVGACLAQTFAADQYQVWNWFPAKPLNGYVRTGFGNAWRPVHEKGVAQRVRLKWFGPQGAKRLDLVCWVQDGKVVRKVPSDCFRFADQSMRDWYRESKW